ncbi:hypothetical protein GCM10025771_27800 [Niveibacterium umoris]
MLDQLDAQALDSIAPPWDALAQISSGAAARLQPQWLTNHGWRTYAWGALLALNADLQYDRGLLFAACQLHDLGLTSHDAHPVTECFTLRSARLARSILKQACASADEISRVEEAIILHMNLDVSIEQGVEAHLLQAGAGLDVVGLRFNEVPPTLRDAVLEKYPRLGFKGHICRCMSHEARAAPNSRAGLFVRRLGFLDLVAASPFDD